MTNVLCPVCISWARSGGEGTFDAPHHPRCPVPGAAVDLLAACKAAYDHATADPIARLDQPQLNLLRKAIAAAEGTS